MKLVTVFLDALPKAASNELAFVSYFIVVVSWFLLGWRIKRNKNLLTHIDKLPEKDRLKALELEMGAARLKSGLSPDQWMKAKIHQYIFVGFVILCFAAITVFAIAGFNAFGKVSLSMNLYKYPEQTSHNWLNDTTLQYKYDVVDETIIVTPQLKYLSDISSGKTVEGLRYSWEPFGWSFPSLSLKMANNSNKTVLVTEILFDVKSNEVNKNPLLYVDSSNYFGTFSINNDGWGDVLSPHLRLSLSHPEKCKDQYTPDNEDIDIPIATFADSHSVSINDVISARLKNDLLQCTEEIRSVCIRGGYCTSGGSDTLKCLDSQKSKICKNVSGTIDNEQVFEMVEDANKYRSEGEPLRTRQDIYYERHCRDVPACVLGGLSYKNKENIEQYFRFKTYVSLGEPDIGAPMPPSYFYDVFIEAGKSNQIVRVPVSHEIKPGDSDHFVINIASDKSARMKISVTAADSEGEVIAQKDLDLNILVSKAGLNYVKGENRSKN